MVRPTRRTVLGSIGGLLGTAGAGTVLAQSDDEDDEPEAPRAPLSVMSYNIHGGVRTDGVYDLQRIADVIEAVDPDVVALQEVHDQYRAHWQDDSPTNYDAQHELLADWLGMDHVLFAAVRDYARSDDPQWTEEEEEEGYRRRLGTAILSKKPILASNIYAHETDTSWDPPHEDVHNRQLAEALIDVDGSHVWFYNTHLHAGTGSRNIELRTAQTEELLEIAGRHDGTKLLAGDFNFPDGEYGWNEAWFQPPYNEPAYQNYTALTDAYTDVLRELGVDAPTYYDDVRIDYLFATDDVKPLDGDTIIYDSEPFPSDHRPIYADVITVPRGKRCE